MDLISLENTIQESLASYYTGIKDFITIKDTANNPEPKYSNDGLAIEIEFAELLPMNNYLTINTPLTKIIYFITITYRSNEKPVLRKARAGDVARHLVSFFQQKKFNGMLYGHFLVEDSIVPDETTPGLVKYEIPISAIIHSTSGLDDITDLPSLLTGNELTPPVNIHTTYDYEV